MSKIQPICVNTNLGYDLEDMLILEEIARAGFDGAFTHWEDGYPIGEWAKKIRELGMIYQSLHAPDRGLNEVWFDEGEGVGEEVIRRAMRCLEDCNRYEVPLMVLHVYSNFDFQPPTQRGADRFERLLNRADQLGVRIGFENLQGEEPLERVMQITGHKSLGFCWDSGHQHCYNENTDMLALYGQHLAGVHLNDNMGRTGENLTSWDDAHMIPFDGIVDWEKMVAKMKATGFTGPLTFEIKHKNKPGRHTQDRYQAMTVQEFLAEIMKAARKLQGLWEKA